MAAATDVFTHVLRIETRLFNALDALLRAELGITAGQFHLLEFIADHPRCRVSDIVRALAISVGAASKTVDKLQAAGWCLRDVDPNDRRSSFVEVTTGGRELLDRAQPLATSELTRLLRDALDTRTLDRLAETLQPLSTHLEDHVVGVPGHAELPAPARADM